MSTQAQCYSKFTVGRHHVEAVVFPLDTIGSVFREYEYKNVKHSLSLVSTRGQNVKIFIKWQYNFEVLARFNRCGACF